MYRISHLCGYTFENKPNRVPLSTVRYDPKPQPLSIDERNELSNSTVNIKNGM